MSNQQKSFVDIILDKLRNNPLIAVSLIAAMFVIGLGQVFGAFNQIFDAFSDGTIPPTGTPEIPNLYGLTYDSARKQLLKKGWTPHTTYPRVIPEEAKKGNGPIFWQKGYEEVKSCVGTGLGFCRFEFTDVSGRLLVVVTAGQESGLFHAKVDKVFFGEYDAAGEPD